MFGRRFLRRFTALAIALPLAVACTKQDYLPGKRSHHSDDRPIVLTTFTILADMARQVAGDRLQVKSITKPGAEIHGYEPSPKDLEQAKCSISPKVELPSMGPSLDAANAPAAFAYLPAASAE